ncbi:unnamed protein product, partial [Tetraodon nigroviridis]
AEEAEELRSSPAWSEERCEELWDRVEGVRHKLTRILHPAKLTPYLRQCKVIDEQDEDEVLNSTQYPLRISKAGRLLDILRGQGQRGLQAFLESLEFYHPEQFTQLTGEPPTQRCSLILDEEGPEGLTQFLLLEVRKLREQLRNSRVCERRLSQRCRVAEDERSRAERKAQELRHDRLQMERLRHDLESASRELGKLKDRHLEQAVKYSRALEEQGKASARERDLLRQRSCCVSLEALMDILQQDRRESAEQRQELCDIITRLQGDLQSTEEQRDKLEAQCEQLQLKVRTLHLDWETEQKRSMSYFNQIMELEKERDQSHLSLCSEDQCYGPCCSPDLNLKAQVNSSRLLLRKASSGGQNNDNSEGLTWIPGAVMKMTTFQVMFLCAVLRAAGCARIHLTVVFPVEQSEPSLWDSCNSLNSDLFPPDLVHMPQVSSPGPTSKDPSPPTSPKQRRASLADDITVVGGNRTGIFVSRVRAGSLAEQCGLKEGSELLEVLSADAFEGGKCCISLAVVQLERVLFGGGSVVLSQCTAEVAHFSLQWWTEPSALKHQSNPQGENNLRVHRPKGDKSPWKYRVMFYEPPPLSVLPSAYSRLCSELSEPSFMGSDSFYVRVNLNIEPHDEPLSLGVSCDDIIHVTDTRYKGKYQWHCSVVDPHTAKPLQTGTMPNYNRAQQMLLVRLQKMALEQKDFRKKVGRPLRLKHTSVSANGHFWTLPLSLQFLKKPLTRVRLVKAVEPSCRGIGSSQAVVYTLSRRKFLASTQTRSRSNEMKNSPQCVCLTVPEGHEEHLIPYSVVQPVHVQTKRPVIFSPSILSRGLIERLLQPAESGLKFDTCLPEPILASERRDKTVFLLDSCSPENTQGIRLQSIQEVIGQDKHCLLELGLPSVEGLLRHGIYPIVVHIRPKTKKHKKLRKFFPRCGEEGMMEEVCQAEELQLETLPLLYFTLEPGTWSCTDELLAAICNAIHSQQRAVAWVELDRLQ